MQLRDPKVRKAYREALTGRGVKNAPKGLVDIKEARRLWAQAKSGGRVTPRGFLDIYEISIRGRLGPKAKRFLSARAKDLIIRWGGMSANGNPPLIGKRLGLLVSALKSQTRGLSFKSPLSGYAYTAAHYNAVANLIAAGDVVVFLNDNAVGEVLGHGGWYSPERHSLYIGAGDEDTTIMTLVHEATHVIQDWTNRNIRMRGVEADAFIAMYLWYLKARRGNGRPKGGDNRLYDAAYDAAAEHQRDGKIRRSTYSAVLKEVGKTYHYGAQEWKPSEGKRQEQLERTRFGKAMKQR